MSRHGDWSQVFSGIQFWPLDPLPSEICIEDIAHSLSLQCRFNGHCEEFYSVAQHCVIVARFLKDYSKQVQLKGLLHDAAETYLSDVVRPVKTQPEMFAFRVAEELNQNAIWDRFDLPYGTGTDLIKKADNSALYWEARDLMKKPPVPWSWPKDFAVSMVPEKKLKPWSSKKAEREFLFLFKELSGMPLTFSFWEKVLHVLG